MARKVTTVEITAPGRDIGKKFLLTEMPAYQAEDWAVRALMGVGAAGVNLPDSVLKYGWSGLLIIGLDSLMRIDYRTAKPLLEEMMGCVQIVMQTGPRAIDEISGVDIEEVATRVYLRDKVFELHSGFSVADAIREVLMSAQANNSQMDSSNTQTSPLSSAPSSLPN